MMRGVNRPSLCRALLALSFLFAGAVHAQDGDKYAEVSAPTVLVLWLDDGKATISTGTLLSRDGREGFVFTIMPSCAVERNEKEGKEPATMDIRILFQGDKKERKVTEPVLFGDTKQPWAMIRIAGDDLPPAPVISETPLAPAAPVVRGYYSAGSFIGTAPVASIQPGLVTTVQPASADAPPVPEIDWQVAPTGAGGPVFDATGRLRALADQCTPGAAGSQTIPLRMVWEFVCRKSLTLEFERARSTPNGWQVACRLGISLPRAIGAGVKIRLGPCPGGHIPEFPFPGELLSERPWLAGKASGTTHAFLLPVSPPEQEERLYFFQFRVDLAGGGAIDSPASVLAITYAGPPQGRRDWLRPLGGQP